MKEKFQDSQKKENTQQMSFFSVEEEVFEDNFTKDDANQQEIEIKQPILKAEKKLKKMQGEEKIEEQNITEQEDLQVEQKKGLFWKIRFLYRSRNEKRLKQMGDISTEESKKVEEKLETSKQEVQEFKSGGKKKTIKNILFLIFNLALVVGILLWNILSSDDFSPISSYHLNLEFLFCALLLLLAVVLLDTMTIHRMIYRKTLRSRWFLSYKSVALLRYYDAVTPLASGGQAFMVSYLTNRDVSGSTALSIPISKLLFQNISWLLVTSVCLIISLCNGMGAFVSTTSIIGFLLAFFLVVFILFVSLSKKAGIKLVSWCITLLVKMHILKSYDKYYQKTINFVEDYQNIMKEYSRSKWDVFYQLVLHVMRHVAVFCIPFFIYCAFKGWEPAKFGEFFMYTALIDLASSFIPLPGGTGMNEITFTYLFNQYLGGATFWALLFWRFCSYYYYLLQGLVVQTYDTVYGNRKYRWVKKKLALQEESREFKRVQIESFRKERLKRRKNIKKDRKVVE